MAAARIRAAGWAGSARASGAPYKGPGQGVLAEYGPKSVPHFFSFFLNPLGRKIKINTKLTPKITK